ncbi:MAG: hypothetical protein Q9208_007184, partial [Pyrenodesmia sp. 3 TL-2023]
VVDGWPGKGEWQKAVITQHRDKLRMQTLEATHGKSTGWTAGTALIQSTIPNVAEVQRTVWMKRAVSWSIEPVLKVISPGDRIHATKGIERRTGYGHV